MSDKSGVAETLRHHLGRQALPMIVDIVDDVRPDVRRWTSAMQRVLNDLPQAFAYAHEVRGKLNSMLSWDAMVETLVARLAHSPAAVPTSRYRWSTGR